MTSFPISAASRSVRETSAAQAPGGDAAFDRVARLAARLLDASVALVCLVDDSGPSVKGRFGPRLFSDTQEIGLCAHALIEETAAIVPDVRLDPRFSVAAPGGGRIEARFYAAAPLRLSEGGLIGAICLIDPEPRSAVEPEAQASLADLAELVAHDLEVHRGANTLAAETLARRRAEQGLRDHADRLDLALSLGNIHVFSQDRDLRYTWTHHPILLGISGPPIGKTDEELFGVSNAERLAAIKRPVLETGVGRREPVEIATAGGTLSFDLSVMPLRDGGGEVCGITCAAVDLTEERAIKAALEVARAEAERANIAKSRFLAAASHDLRQPLHALRLFLHVLVSRLGDPPLLDMARRAEEAARTTESMLHGLLDISTLEAGVLKPDIVTLSVGEVTMRLARELDGQAAAAGLRLRVVPSRAKVLSDPLLLDRILRNLLLNAIRYTSKGKVLLGARRAGEKVRIAVWDTGPGIPEDKLRAIFEEFYQHGPFDGQHVQGLGLGLAIVERTAQLLGHRVGVRSKLGHGSMFFVELPLAGP